MCPYISLRLHLPHALFHSFLLIFQTFTFISSTWIAGMCVFFALVLKRRNLKLRDLSKSFHQIYGERSSFFPNPYKLLSVCWAQKNVNNVRQCFSLQYTVNVVHMVCKGTFIQRLWCRRRDENPSLCHGSHVYASHWFSCVMWVWYLYFSMFVSVFFSSWLCIQVRFNPPSERRLCIHSTRSSSVSYFSIIDIN